MPVISPLAIAGAAPRMTTKRIAPSSSWNNTMASGNQAIDGIVWMPVIIEPIARRTIFELETANPMATPMTIDRAKPTIARWNVIPTARRTSPLSVMSHNEPATARGPGSAYSGFQPLHTTHCQANRKIATAASFGQVASNTARAVSRRGRRDGRGRGDVRRRWFGDGHGGHGELVSCEHGPMPRHVATR